MERFHLIPGIGTVLLVVISSFVSYHFGSWTEQKNKLRELRFDEYVKVTDAENALNVALDDFTKNLTTTKRTDPKLARTLEKSIAVQYGAIDAYLLNIPADRRKVLVAYKTELAKMKASLQKVKTIQDLEHFGINISRVYEARKRASPVFEVSIGRS